MICIKFYIIPHNVTDVYIDAGQVSMYIPGICKIKGKGSEALLAYLHTKM